MTSNVKNSLKKEKNGRNIQFCISLQTFWAMTQLRDLLFWTSVLYKPWLFTLWVHLKYIYIHTYVCGKRNRVDFFLLLFSFYFLIAFFSPFLFFVFSISKSQFLTPCTLTVRLLPPLSTRSIPPLFPLGKDQTSQG